MCIGRRPGQGRRPRPNARFIILASASIRDLVQAVGEEIQRFTRVPGCHPLPGPRRRRAVSWPPTAEIVANSEQVYWPPVARISVP